MWDNPAHNSTRKACFKTLASACLAALKAGKFPPTQLKEIREKLAKLAPKSAELEVCLNHVDAWLKADQGTEQ